MDEIRIETYKQAFLSRERGVRAARVLFDYLSDAVNPRGYVERRKSKIAADLNVSPRTVANYVYTLIDMDLIKRKYDGKTVINPEYCFCGSAAELDAAKKAYADFKSDEIKKGSKKNGKKGFEGLKAVQEST